MRHDVPGDHTEKELARGNMEQVLVKGNSNRGYILITGAGGEAVRMVLAKPNAKLGLIFFEVKRTAEAVSKLIWSPNKMNDTRSP